MTTHAACTHPSTSAARKACREGRNTIAFPQPGTPSKNGAAQAFRDRIKANRAKAMPEPAATLYVTAEGKLSPDADHDDTTRATAARLKSDRMVWCDGSSSPRSAFMAACDASVARG